MIGLGKIMPKIQKGYCKPTKNRGPNTTKLEKHNKDPIMRRATKKPEGHTTESNI